MSRACACCCFSLFVPCPPLPWHKFIPWEKWKPGGIKVSPRLCHQLLVWFDPKAPSVLAGAVFVTQGGAAE